MEATASVPDEGQDTSPQIMEKSWLAEGGRDQGPEFGGQECICASLQCHASEVHSRGSTKSMDSKLQCQLGKLA